MLRRRHVPFAAAAGVLLLLAPLTVSAQPACTFTLGFAALRDLIPDAVGECLSDESHNSVNGDALQETTGGLLVWRKSDNQTVFTDGSTTWLHGPCGLQSRPNGGPFFTWEGRDLPICTLGIKSRLVAPIARPLPLAEQPPAIPAPAAAPAPPAPGQSEVTASTRAEGATQASVRPIAYVAIGASDTVGVGARDP
jgi:hypothetical protein